MPIGGIHECLFRCAKSRKDHAPAVRKPPGDADSKRLSCARQRSWQRRRQNYILGYYRKIDAIEVVMVNIILVCPSIDNNASWYNRYAMRGRCNVCIYVNSAARRWNELVSKMRSNLIPGWRQTNRLRKSRRTACHHGCCECHIGKILGAPQHSIQFERRIMWALTRCNRKARARPPVRMTRPTTHCILRCLGCTSGESLSLREFR